MSTSSLTSPPYFRRILTFLILSASSLWLQTEACNEVVCASIVSKCMLTQACKCDLTKSPDNECTCCANCIKCLGYLYTECCSCLGMCEPRTHGLSKKDSQVGDLPEPFPQLFQAFTSDKDVMLRWTSMTFPIDISLSELGGNALDKNKYTTVSHPQVSVPHEQVTVNCSILYMAQCMSGSKCKDTCKSMGATAYRWFFDGCCECVGSTCINYGVNESRCIDCPVAGDDEEFDEELTDHILAGNSAKSLTEAGIETNEINDPADPTQQG